MVSQAIDSPKQPNLLPSVSILLEILDGVVVQGFGIAIATVAQPRVTLAGDEIGFQRLLAIPAFPVRFLREVKGLLHSEPPSATDLVMGG